MNKHFPPILVFCTLCISSLRACNGQTTELTVIKISTTADLADFWRKPCAENDYQR